VPHDDVLGAELPLQFLPELRAERLEVFGRFDAEGFQDVG